MDDCILTIGRLLVLVLSLIERRVLQRNVAATDGLCRNVHELVLLQIFECWFIIQLHFRIQKVVEDLRWLLSLQVAIPSMTDLRLLGRNLLLRSFQRRSFETPIQVLERRQT